MFIIGKSWILNQLFCPFETKNEDFNTIFEESDGIESQTSHLKYFQSALDLITLKATDTPGISDSKGRTETFINMILSEMKSRPYIILIVLKYGRMSENVKRSLEVLRLCFSNNSKDSSTVAVINRVPWPKKNSRTDYNAECELMFNEVSQILGIEISKRLNFQEDDEKLKEKIKQLLLLIKYSKLIVNRGFKTWKELLEFHNESIKRKLD